jgi:hypothetical protein
MQVLLDDVFLLINSKFGDNVDRILSIALPRKDTTDTVRFVSYLVTHLGNDSESRMGNIETKCHFSEDDSCI